MMRVLLMLAVSFQIHGIMGGVYDNNHNPVILPNLPEKNEFCEYDAFLSSEPYNNNKVFLCPWNKADRVNDWITNAGYCAKHCAEMVTIHSAAENQHFLDFFANSCGFDSGNIAIWLGAVVTNKTLTGWVNGETNDYNPVTSPEYNEDGLTCLTAFYGNNNNNWFNYYCDWSTTYFVACQRPASWTICGGGAA